MEQLLSETEQRVLECLISRSRSTAGRLAQLTTLKRPTVYAALESLRLMGLVGRSTARGVTEFRPIDIALIPKVLIEKAEKRIESVRHEAQQLGDRLSAIAEAAPQAIAGYEILALESREAVQLNLEQALLKGNYSAIFNPQIVLVGEVKKLVAKFLKESTRLSPPIREICVDGPEVKWYLANIKNKNHQVRLIPAATKIRSDMIFIDGTVILSHYAQGGELAIRVTQRDYYDSMMALFELTWASAACT